MQLLSTETARNSLIVIDNIGFVCVLSSIEYCSIECLPGTCRIDFYHHSVASLSSNRVQINCGSPWGQRCSRGKYILLGCGVCGNWGHHPSVRARFPHIKPDIVSQLGDIELYLGTVWRYFVTSRLIGGDIVSHLVTLWRYCFTSGLIGGYCVTSRLIK